jgi:hypothetical protein
MAPAGETKEITPAGKTSVPTPEQVQKLEKELEQVKNRIRSPI